MRKRIVLTMLALAAVAAGCGGHGGGGARAGETTDVVASFYPLAFAAEQIGGAGVEVVNITPAGAEPHDVELSARDVERVRSADLVLYFSGGFQPALERALEGEDVRALDLLGAGELLPGGGQGHDDEHAGETGGADEGGTRDPHVWLDPLRYAKIAAQVGRTLDRERAADGFALRLRELDRELRQGLAGCERREIVTSHAAFGYLAERYGLEQIAITGLSPEAEPTARELERVVAEVRAHEATTVFFETLVSPRLAETVARETGAATAVLDPIEGLTREQLERGEDYFSLMRANLETLREALACP